MNAKVLNGKMSVVDETLSTIDAALTILNNFPEIDTNNVHEKYNNSVRPLPFIMDILERFVGFDGVLNMVNDLLFFVTDIMEAGVKAAMLLNLKNIFTCTINPMITQDLLKNGVVFDLDDIDALRLLQYSPLSQRSNETGKPTNKGRYYYFGCDSFNFSSELSNAADFNAFLWYVKNKAIDRVAWRGVPLKAQYLPSVKNDKTIEIPEDNNSKRYLFGNRTLLQNQHYYRNDPNVKDEKKHGIITLEYNSSYEALRDCFGKKMTKTVDVPLNNCLHVFLGDTEAFSDGEFDAKIYDYDAQINKLYNEIGKKRKEIKDEIKKYEKKYNEIEKARKKEGRDGVTSEMSDLWLKICACNAELEGLDANGRPGGRIKEINDKIEKLNKEVAVLVNENDTITKTYHTDIKNNYYYGRDLFTFNYDYIMSLKLFDAKTIIVKLIEQLTNCYTIDIDLSFESIVIKNEVERIVTKLIEEDDLIISDCFFTFDNKEYDAMLRKAELIRAGLFTVNGEENGLSQVGMDLIEKINNISDNATQEEIETTIKGAMYEISKTVSEVGDSTRQTTFNHNIQHNFAMNLINNIAFVVAQTVVTPKLYLLYAMNLKIVGMFHPLKQIEFISQQRKLISDTIRDILAKITEFLIDKIKKLLKNLALEIIKVLGIEQIEYYIDKLIRCTECFRNRNGLLDFQDEEVNYADIYTDENPPNNNENNC